MGCAISSVMPIFLHTTRVPIIDRRAGRVVSATDLNGNLQHTKSNEKRIYPPDLSLCLRDHTPAMMSPSKCKVRPCRSVRGPRGSPFVKPCAFPRPRRGRGCNISPWVIEEENERAMRAESHERALS
ncbi:unnamed protein product, partial [Choristocarpus tenellus]